MPSAHRPKLADVAARVGVSTATASLVLRGQPGPSPATRDVVLRAADDLGYRPDRSASLLARRRSRLIGVTMDVRSTFHGELVESLQGEADRLGYDLVVGPLSRTHDEDRAVETLIDFRCEGLLLLGSTLPSADLAALGKRCAVVSVGRTVRASDVDVVRAADDRGVALAVEHCAGLGHRSVAYVDGPASPIASRRRRGFEATARRLGLDARVLAGAGAEVVGRRGGEATAYVAFNDHAALMVLDQLRRSGRSVPGDVSVTGFDDSPTAALATVDLTSVSQDPAAMAAAAIETLDSRLGGREERLEKVLEPLLVVRGTTGPGPAARTS